MRFVPWFRYCNRCSIGDLPIAALDKVGRGRLVVDFALVVEFHMRAALGVFLATCQFPRFTMWQQWVVHCPH